jgi:hypothetical protein
VSPLGRIQASRRWSWVMPLGYFLGHMAGALTFLVGLNLIYAALGLGISYIAFQMVISNLGFGLAAVLSGITTMRIAGRGTERLTKVRELARHEAIRKAAFGNGNGGA